MKGEGSMYLVGPHMTPVSGVVGKSKAFKSLLAFLQDNKWLQGHTVTVKDLRLWMGADCLYTGDLT